MQSFRTVVFPLYVWILLLLNVFHFSCHIQMSQNVIVCVNKQKCYNHRSKTAKQNSPTVYIIHLFAIRAAGTCHQLTNSPINLYSKRLCTFVQQQKASFPALYDTSNVTMRKTVFSLTLKRISCHDFMSSCDLIFLELTDKSK